MNYECAYIDITGKLLEGKKGSYVCEAKIGNGGNGKIYKGRVIDSHGDIDMPSTVALKQIPANKNSNEIYFAHLLSNTPIEGLAPVYEAFVQDNHCYVIMPFISGTRLSDTIDRFVPNTRNVSVSLPCIIVLQIAHTINHLHNNNIAHLDIKPSNILLTGINRRPILIDYGTMRHIRNKKGTDTSIFASHVTDGYSAPELYDCNYSMAVQSDIFSLGALLYKLSTGKTPPCSCSDGFKTFKHSQFDSVPYIYRDVLNKSMAINAHHRYKDMTALIGDLAECLEVTDHN
ncbi:MAG: serine/threonine protein kinase [Muribaculaceae bacterium]|nr:serine/threonine protein kinase [Muribaculaceae bacterium]